MSYLQQFFNFLLGLGGTVVAISIIFFGAIKLAEYLNNDDIDTKDSI